MTRPPRATTRPRWPRTVTPPYRRRPGRQRHRPRLANSPADALHVASVTDADQRHRRCSTPTAPSPTPPTPTSPARPVHLHRRPTPPTQTSQRHRDRHRHRINDAPTAVDDTAPSMGRGRRTNDRHRLVGNDTDPDLANTPPTCCRGLGHRRTRPTAPRSLNADGTVTYTPDANYAGPDSFTYTVADPADTQDQRHRDRSPSPRSMTRRPRATTRPPMWPKTAHAP